MTAAQGDRRRSAPAGPTNGVRELFKAEDVRLEWSFVRRTVGVPACTDACAAWLLPWSFGRPSPPSRSVIFLLLCFCCCDGCRAMNGVRRQGVNGLGLWGCRRGRACRTWATPAS